MEGSAQLIANKIVSIIINPALAVLFAAGLLVFVFGLVEFMREISRGGDTKTGKSHMLYGILGMFIMVSVFGIIHVISNTFGFGINSGSYNPSTTTFSAGTF